MTLRRFAAILLCGGLLAGALLTGPLYADDDKATKEAETNEAAENEAPVDDRPLVEQVNENPNDAKLLNAYFSAEFRAISGLLSTDIDAAAERLDALKSTVGELEPTDDKAIKLLKSGERAIEFYGNRIELVRTPLEEIVKSLKATPGDAKAVSTYVSKVSMEAEGVVETDAAKAQQHVDDANALITELKDATEDEDTQKLLDNTIKRLASVDRSIKSKIRQIEVIGEDAAPLKVAAWVNGEPLTDADLKGKVVMLDFWAVWCGPCIATFPHLREWQETYGDKGLVIIGVTDYYGFEWNEEAGAATRGDDVSPEDEQAMLVKFAEEHDLKHRFALREDRDLSEYYGVSGIPHVAVIDQEGKVRMIKVGSGPANAKEIGDLLAELLK